MNVRYNTKAVELEQESGWICVDMIRMINEVTYQSMVHFIV